VPSLSADRIGLDRRRRLRTDAAVMGMSEVVLEYGFSEPDRKRIVDLLREYEAGTGVSLCFQDFDAEVAGLPGDYAPPGGTMLLAREVGGEEFLGCVALRPVPDRPDLRDEASLRAPGATGRRARAHPGAGGHGRGLSAWLPAHLS